MKNLGYAVYDTKDNYICVGIYNTAAEVAKNFEIGKGSVLSGISRSNLIKHRYKVERTHD